MGEDNKTPRVTITTKRHNRLQFALMTVLILAANAAQTAYASNYGKLIGKHDYVKAEKEMNRHKEKMTSQADFFEYNYWRAVMLCRPDYARHNALKGYNIFVRLQRKFISDISPKEQEKIKKMGITAEVLSAQTDTACLYGLEEARKANQLEAYEAYIHGFDLARAEFRDSAIMWRDQLAFDEAKKENTVAAYDSFIVRYPFAPQITQAKELMETLYYDEAKENNTISSYASFLRKYPTSVHRRELEDSIWTMAFHEAKRINKAEAYNEYAELYPESPFRPQADSLGQRHAYADLVKPGSWSSLITFLTLYPGNKEYRQQALEDLKKLSIAQKSPKGLLFYLKHTGETAERKALEQQLYSMLSKDGELSTLDFIKKEFPQLVGTQQFEKDYKAAQEIKALNLRSTELTAGNQQKLTNYIMANGQKDLATVALQTLIKEDLRVHNYEKAHSTVLQFKKAMKDNPDWSEMEQLLRNIGVTNAPNKRGDQYYPIIAADGKKLYFCGRDRDDNLGGEDVFVTEYAHQVWSKPKIFAPLSRKESNDGILAVSADGTQMIKFENGIMGMCSKTEKGWQPVEFFPLNINRGEWNSDATLCSDGRTLLFASIRPSGSNINQANIYHADNHYQSDIYMSQRDSSGIWSEPVNLGPAINTIYSERTPFMHPDMHTIYFSSDGRGGMGGYDVYKATRLSDTCWTCWSEPENLGKEINTIHDDWTYKISTDGQMAYFSQKETDNNRSNIYCVNLPAETQPHKVVTVKGKMVNRAGKKVVTKVMWEDLETNKIVGMAQTDPDDGSFFVVLPAGKMYGIFVADSTVYPETRHLDTRKVDSSKDLEKTFHVTTIEELKQGKAITINNIFFDFNKSELLKFSFPELRRLAKLIQKEQLKVEISGHTDNVGSDEVNNKLSQDRAESVRKFLIQNGCPDASIVARGYGKTKPVAPNDTERGRARNRRVEMQVIK